MVYNTEHGASLQELPPDNNKFLENNKGYYCWKLRKGKVKH